jgi:putative transposase
MNYERGEIYHIYNQGNNRQKLFFNRDNYLYFINKMRVHLKDHCDIFAWCLMPNHFHWLVKVKDHNIKHNKGLMDTALNDSVPPINRSLSTLLSSYTKAINKLHGRSGSLFRSKTKAKKLNSDNSKHDKYPQICFLYIHQNPIRAELVSQLQDWEFSSYRDFAGLRNGSLCNQRLAIELLNLPKNKRDFVSFSDQTIPDEFVKNLF